MSEPRIYITLTEANALRELILTSKFVTWDKDRCIAFSNFSRKLETALKKKRKGDK